MLDKTLIETYSIFGNDVKIAIRFNIIYNRISDFSWSLISRKFNYFESSDLNERKIHWSESENRILSLTIKSIFLLFDNRILLRFNINIFPSIFYFFFVSNNSRYYLMCWIEKKKLTLYMSSINVWEWQLNYDSLSHRR